MTANCNCAVKTVQSGLAAMYRLDGMVYAVGTGVATALKVVQRHSPFLVKPEENPRCGLGRVIQIFTFNIIAPVQLN